MAALEIDYEDRVYLLDLDDMDTDQVRAIERAGIPNLKALESRLLDGDLTAIMVYYWLCLVQNGEPAVRLERVKCKPLKFFKAYVVAVENEALRLAALDAEDPKED